MARAVPEGGRVHGYEVLTNTEDGVVMESLMANKRILVVDDSSTTQLLVQLLVERGEYDVETAYDREDALAKAKQQTPDLIVMDVEMPLGYLYSSDEGLRARTRVIQFITVTATGARTGDRIAFDCDRTGRAREPVDPAEVLAKIRGCLGE
jgi:CheY-like chemotaxis protein